jgi:hypothetical protein
MTTTDILPIDEGMRQPSPTEIAIEAGTIRARLDPRNAAILSLESTDGAWRILDRVTPGFVIRIPRPDRRNDPADSDAQAPPTWDIRADGTGATASWRSLRTASGVDHAVRVTVEVRAVEARLVFAMTIENGSDGVIEEVQFPRLGDVTAPSGTLDAVCYRYAAATRSPLRPTFRNVPGYYGVDRPTYLNEGEGTVGAPVAPFLVLDGGDRGLLLAVDEPSSELVGWHAELHPGWIDSISRSVPTSDDGLPERVRVQVTAAQLPWIEPGGSRTLTPVALSVHDGDWHAGVDGYIARRDAWMGSARPPSWASGPDAWLQLHVNSPEDELRMSFDQLPDVARECADAGIRIIQLVGWNVGGQDRENPSHHADPRLGGRDALIDAIAACQRLGVRVVLFAKFTWADRSSERYRAELHREAIKDPYGDPYLHHGYRYQTMTQLFDVGTRRLVPMCFASPRYRDVCDEHFLELLALGADGMLFDESLHHTPALLCFDASHGHRPGWPVYAADRDLLARFRSVAAGRDANFLYAGEACYDWEFEEYELSYHRSWEQDHVPLSRYLRPHVQLMTAVTGFDDRNIIGQALMYRYVLSYEPYFFKGRPGDMPASVSYGRAMDQLRTELRRWFWDGRFRDDQGARVEHADGRPHRHWSRFDGVDGAGPGLVICNYAEEEVRLDVTVSEARAMVTRTIEHGSWTPLDRSVTIGPRSAIVAVPADRL